VTGIVPPSSPTGGKPEREKLAMPPTDNPQPMLLTGLIVRRVRVPPREVVFVKGVFEASEGVAAVFADSGGDLTIATLPSQKDELDRILQDLRDETGALLDFT
jgi:hypothetical protein